MNDASPPASQSSAVGGKVVVAGIFMVAAVATLFAWWWRYTNQREIQEFWGKAAQQTIGAAPQVEAFLAPAIGSQAELTEALASLGGEKFIDLSRAPGLVHARHSLLDQASFDWPATAALSSDAPGNWTHGVRFTRSEHVATVLFDFDSHRLLHVESGKQGQLIEKSSHDWLDYLSRRAFSQER
jgi:hypothetical protein